MTENLPTSGFGFHLLGTDPDCAARRSTLLTPHGSVDLPAFMPVGTLGTVKGVELSQLRSTAAQMVLCNTYHLALRPGAELVHSLGGLHRFMGWTGPILTDSGGFQVFSLAERTKVDEQSAKFRSHIDGSLMELSPERAMEIQHLLGSDIAMVLDHVIALPNSDEMIREAAERSIRWAGRCRDTRFPKQAQFGIIQGGLHEGLRISNCEQLIKLDFDGYAVGGLSVGEPPAEMYRVLDFTCPAMPANRPRYLMGVGRPQDLLEAVRRGIDLFDCVMPTRNGRNALAFTDEGTLRMRNEQHRSDDRPIASNCGCAACQRSRGYIRHLFMAKEMLGPILVSIHNLTYYQRILSEARSAIEKGQFLPFFDKKLAQWAA
ncbi:MAG: tRNA guanosine(34) transglycosylase Tgt [Pirellulaceae bacterium]|nr:tRNA guanosine(34) transglycosylase Tgt [Pirellulaceae bacterium]